MIQIEKQSKSLGDALRDACELAEGARCEFVVPEHLLWAILWQEAFVSAVSHVDDDKYETAHGKLFSYVCEYCPKVPEVLEYKNAEPSSQLVDVINVAYAQMAASSAEHIDVPHIVKGILELKESFAKDVLTELCEGETVSLLSNLVEEYDIQSDADELEAAATAAIEQQKKSENNEWAQYVTCLNDVLDSHNPLIGREAEIERTIQVLCRKDKNNPIHVGEAGVGKTALAYGLAAKIEADEVPERLSGCKVYSLDLGSIMAGTQYRGEFEKRLKAVLNGVTQSGKAILYVDEIHNLIGAGRIEGASLDAANLLKPYLETGELRFMGATTYEEYNRNFSRNKGFARRFEKIDIVEPSVDECKLILMGLKNRYEEYHQVTYTDEAIEYAVTASNKYITGRYLPDKAIDLIDEAGAFYEVKGKKDEEEFVIDKKDIALVLAKICNVDTLAEDKDDIAQLEHLEQHIKSQIYGQNEAVKEMTEAVQMASAGLLDDNKPMASLLFVGPTGVGKTEVAKVLAKELNIPLVRFDMSEYAEKHTVAKLIGSPAGYVGYDDGGLLTDAIRKTPHCVLLFDELEKAHQDIYNILLQVMDYAVLTDNKGQKADFRHVIFIMTTNAGAQFARQGNVGFTKLGSAGDVMMKSVKKTFKPEFLNRLTGITIFHDMTRGMAELILDKKLTQLSEKLSAKKVTMTLTAEAREHLLKEGFSEEYGGREIDRVITTQLKPLLMREILFGRLKEGGDAKITIDNGKLICFL